MSKQTKTETFDSDATMPTARAQKVKLFRKAATEGLETQAKKMKTVSSKKFVKPTIGQNVIVKIPTSIELRGSKICNGRCYRHKRRGILRTRYQVWVLKRTVYDKPIFLV